NSLAICAAAQDSNVCVCELRKLKYLLAAYSTGGQQCIRVRLCICTCNRKYIELGVPCVDHAGYGRPLGMNRQIGSILDIAARENSTARCPERRTNFEARIRCICSGGDLSRCINQKLLGLGEGTERDCFHIHTNGAPLFSGEMNVSILEFNILLFKH